MVRGDAKTFVERGGTSEGASVSRIETTMGLPELPPLDSNSSTRPINEKEKKELSLKPLSCPARRCIKIIYFDKNSFYSMLVRMYF